MLARPPGFYRSSAFYISAAALAVSVAALFVSWPTGPIASIMRPGLEYSYQVLRSERPDEDGAYRDRVVAQLWSNSDSPVADVFVAIVTGVENVGSVAVQPEIEYARLPATGGRMIIKLRQIPPRFRVTVDVRVDVPSELHDSASFLVPRIEDVYSRSGPANCVGENCR